MDSAQKYFLAVTLIIGLIIGLAVGFLFYSFSKSPFVFLIVPVCMAVVFFQMKSNAMKKIAAQNSDDDD